MKSVRGVTLRSGLDHLSDEQWSYAVRSCVSEQDWFPTLHELLSYAEDAPKPIVPAITDGRTREERREEFRKGLEFMKAQLRERGFDVSADPVKDIH